MSSLIKKLKEIPVGVRASVAYTISSVIQNGISFFTIPLFTRMMSKPEYGKSVSFLSWENIMMIFISLYLAYGSFNTAMVKFEDRRSQYISTINTITTVFASVFLIIYFPFRSIFNTWFKMPTIFVVLMMVHILANHSLNCWSSRQRFEYKYVRAIAVAISMAVITPIVSYIFIKNTSDNKGYAYILSYILVTSSFGITIYVIQMVQGRKPFDKEFWKYALKFNIPLIPYYLSQSIFNQSDRIMIDHMCGGGDTAEYGVGYSIAMVLTFVLNAINNSYVPWLYELLKKKDCKPNQKMACYIAIIMAVLLVGVVALGPELVFILGGAKYNNAKWVIPPVALSLLLLFYSQMFINVEFYFEDKKRLVYGTVGAAILNIVLNFLLIPIFGFIAAAYTTLASYLAFAGMNYISYRKTLKANDMPQELYNMKWMVTILLAFTAVDFMIVPLYNFRIARFVIIGVVGIAVLANYKNFIRLYKSFKEK